MPVPRTIGPRSTAKGLADDGTVTTSDGRPLYRLAIHEDLRRVTVTPSKHTEEAYAQWVDGEEGRVLTLEPMTAEQLRSLSDAILASIRTIGGAA
jgi:hypothetical protein